MAPTTIQIEKATKVRLEKYKLHHSESYNDVLQRILEDLSVLSEQTRKDIARARREIKAGRFKTHEQVGRELGFA